MRSPSDRPATDGEGGAGLLPEENPDAGEDSTDETDRSVLPERATLQLLPGRFEPIDSGVVRQEVRFLRASDPQRGVTLGWDEGRPPYHVTLDHPSIQPRHAKMRFRGGRWWIENLSRKDPVVVNDERLRTDEGPRALENGDRVSFGRAEFVFRWP